MARAWLDERLSVLIPALQGKSEADIAELCAQELADWKARPGIKFSSLRPVMTAARKALGQIKLTPENRYRNARTGKDEHIALKYLNFTIEEWAELNQVGQAKLAENLEDQRLLDQPQAVIERAEKLLHSERWDDLLTGLALATGRRLTELLKTGRFFPKTQYTVTFDGQLKRRDLALKPYEIPVLVDAEIVLAAWHRLRSLEDCTSLDNEQVAQRYSKTASENAVRQLSGLIPQRSTKEDLYTHAFRAVYARLVVLHYCPVAVNDLVYVNAVLGHYQATDETTRRQFAATMHYFDYRIGDGSGQIDGRQGISLDQPGVSVLEVFNRRKQPMTSTSETQEQTTVLETAPAKTRGVITTKPGTFSQFSAVMQARSMRKHDELVTELLANDATYQQISAILKPLAGELDQPEENPVALLQTLVSAYKAGGAGPQASELAGLMQEVSDQETPVSYLRGLVERDRSFKKALENRHAGTDYASLTMSQLMSIKTPQAATERFKRAVDAIMAHNQAQTDPLHFWYINAAAVRDLVGGRNDAVQAYLETRPDAAEHNKAFNLTPRQNSKPVLIESEVIVEAGWTKPKGKPRKGQADDEE